MFWNLLLAHFLADYPLQNSWMAANKDRWQVLALHAGMHFVVMMLVISPAWRELWPYILLLALVHFLIDRGKLALNTARPDWVILPYLIDQLLHYLILGAAAWWIARTQGNPTLALDPGLAILATGYLLGTYVWAISEKVLTAAQPEAQQEWAASLWPRMAVRALLLTGLLWLLYPGRAGIAGLLQGTTLPYLSGSHARRVLFTDLLVTMGAWLFIIAAFWLHSGGL